MFDADTSTAFVLTALAIQSVLLAVQSMSVTRLMQRVVHLLARLERADSTKVTSFEDGERG